MNYRGMLTWLVMACEQLASQLEQAHYKTCRARTEPLRSESNELLSYEFFSALVTANCAREEGARTRQCCLNEAQPDDFRPNSDNFGPREWKAGGPQEVDL